MEDGKKSYNAAEWNEIFIIYLGMAYILLVSGIKGHERRRTRLYKQESNYPKMFFVNSDLYICPMCI